jgi:FkbM family methyltransferase
MFAWNQPLGRALRLPLELLPKKAVLPVLRGYNRGLRWIVGAGTHGCWLGRYEQRELDWLLARITSDDVVWDIGAHAGFITMACATRCKWVVACEPLPSNAANLSRHLEMNRLANVSLVRAAIGRQSQGSVSFGGSDSSYENRIGDRGITVPLTSIDALVAAGQRPPSVIKMDIEGGEVDALLGAENTLSVHRPRLMVAVHSTSLATQTEALLKAANFNLVYLNPETFWAVPGEQSAHSVQ